jgi:hypothetical protein
MLVEAGAEVDALSQRWTPAARAALGARREIAEYLISRGADPDARADERTVKEWLEIGGLPGAHPSSISTVADDRFVEVIRGFMGEASCVEEYAARHARRMCIAGYELLDSEADRWLKRFHEIQRDPELLAEVEEKFLVGDELRQARLSRKAKVRRQERDGRRERSRNP